MKIKLLIAIYIIGIPITYGYAYRETIRDNAKNHPMLNPYSFVDSEALQESIFWPLYVPCNLSRKAWSNL